MKTYTLAGPAAPTAPEVLDPAQQAVVDHPGGPLLVLAGPGTGKTTTLVESVVDLVERRGVDPASVLVLTFSRKAAEQVRDRVTARLRRTLGTTVAATFHSFAYSVVRHYADAEAYAASLRLLDAAQQDVVLRDLLRPTAEAVRWPEEFAEAVGTRGFAREVRMLLDRARERGVGPEELAKLGADVGRPEWETAGEFLDQYLTVLDADSALDYADLVARAAALAARPDVRADLHRRYSWVFVDEYQDTDPAQVSLLQAVAGSGRTLVAVGDPDQSIYGFRGAEVRGLLDFPDRFRTRAGDPAPVVALRATRRFGPTLLQASRRIAAALPSSGSIPRAAFAAFRSPVPVGEQGPGEVEVLHADTARAEIEHVADRLRRAHLEDGIAWSQMAVLVRNGGGTIPGLRRALGVAGVPVEVAVDDTALVEEPAVRSLLDALEVALGRHLDDPADPGYVDADRVVGLLTGPLGGMDAAGVRSLARILLRQETGAAAAEGRAARPSRQLVRDAVLRESGRLAQPIGEGGPAARAAAQAHRLAALLDRVAEADRSGDCAESLLWLLWSGTGWPERLHAAAVSGGRGASAAHRDLDAVTALFQEAAKAEERRGPMGARPFVETLLARELPADSMADRGVRAEGVRLLTAHRAKGLEWELVVVAQVQEGLWPDLRRRSSLLGADEIPAASQRDAGGPILPVDVRTVLAEERRLFYVACTRARRRLLVTAVASADEDGDQPSRFTGELGVEAQPVRGRPARPMSLSGVVAELRRTVADEEASPTLRRAAAHRLARLAGERRGDAALVPSADPASWWGMRDRSRSEQPVRPADEPMVLSASALEGLLTCPARWFLEREAGGAAATTSAQGFGSVVHGIADRLAREQFPADVRVEDLLEHVDRVWGLMRFRTPWSRPREREEIRAALAKLLAWHRRPGGREILATERELRATVVVEGEPVRLHGFADRLEIDAAGRVVVVDLKTAKQHPSRAEVEEHPQLALYQLAVENGAVDDLLDRPGVPGGAELLQLRTPKPQAVVQQQEAPVAEADGRRPVEVRVAEAVRRIRDEDFPARAGKHCAVCPFTSLCPQHVRGTVLG